ncbi:MAG TPA: hypothetical protein VL737_02240 [Candidatus Pristimantibacillus sp.]|nr:hypothetical protein [Candidatus Pristimantibacillus sp.]
MEFMNRGAAQSAAPVRVNNGGAAHDGGGSKRGRWKEGPTWMRVVWIVLLFSATVVLVALVALLYMGGPKESAQIDTKKQQAVFLTNGQVYFGKIKSVNSKFVDLRGIYYLNVNQQVQPNQGQQQQQQSSISLVKLGCELHGPLDQMVINRDQVTFWENLKDDGQVAQAIQKWTADNPGGQKCQTATSNTTPAKP